LGFALVRQQQVLSKMLNEDIEVRDYLKKKLAHASVGRVVIERPAKNARITVYSARPGRGHRQERRGHRTPEG
jgi:ribosomal protein S3